MEVQFGARCAAHLFLKKQTKQSAIVEVSLFYQQNSSFSYNNMLLSNVSVEDRGECWWAVVDANNQCVLTAKNPSSAQRALLDLLPLLCKEVLTAGYSMRCCSHCNPEEDSGFEKSEKELNSFNETSHKKTQTTDNCLHIYLFILFYCI